MYTTLIDAYSLVEKLSDPQWVIIDCRFSLSDGEYGRRNYAQAHLPGAVYAHMNEDLSGEIIPGKTGRHPLPMIDQFAQRLSSWGIDSTTQVVVYDDGGGLMAARLWWMLRWLGHDAVAVLDGGWQHWQQEGYPTTTSVKQQQARQFIPQPRNELLFQSTDVLAILNDPEFVLIDGRAVERYRGDVEPIDPIAGHIPGALCLPYTENLTAQGQFLTSETLRSHFQALLLGKSPKQAVFYCGSGISAAHNLLALAYAGLGEGCLYAGSWSEWITDPNRPIAKGEDS